MDELTCVGCSLVIQGDTPETVIDVMASHFENCPDAQALLRQSEMADVAEMVIEDAAMDVAGHLLSLSIPIIEPDEDGDPEVVGMSTVFFGPYATAQEVKDAGDAYLLAVAGFNCGDDDCQHEHAHEPNVISFHTTDALAGFIESEKEQWTEVANHRKTCSDCMDEDGGE